MVSEVSSVLRALLTMKGLINLFLLVVAMALVVYVLRRIFNNYLRFRGTRIVSCPENKQTVAVELDTPHAAFTSVAGKTELRLSECTRWPERAGCGQMCISQIESSPEECLLRNILSKWYHGKTCCLCGQDLSNINWMEHKPALRSPDGKTVQWAEFKADQVYAILETHQPVCWNCHVAEQFRSEHPGLVIDRGFSTTREV